MKKIILIFMMLLICITSCKSSKNKFENKDYANMSDEELKKQVEAEVKQAFEKLQD